MTYSQITWVAVGLQLLIVEIIALIRHDQLLTDAMAEGARRWMLWPALFGTFCGHFFGTGGALKHLAPYVLIPLCLAVLYRDFFVRDAIPYVNHMEIFLVFLGLGAWFWGAR